MLPVAGGLVEGRHVEETSETSEVGESRRPGPTDGLVAFAKGELTGWKRWEVAWLAVSCLVICGLSLYWRDSPAGIVSATTGVAYTVCAGKGKPVAFLFGMVNTLLYAHISYGAGFYGEVMLNALYYFPMQFYGFHVWRRNMNEATGEVRKRRMSAKGRVALVLGVVVATAAYGFVLGLMGGRLPYVDALTTVVSVFAMVVSIRMFSEQWIMWTVVNAVSVGMWAVAFAGGVESIATFAMWAIYLANGIVMYVKWAREIAAESPAGQPAPVQA